VGGQVPGRSRWPAGQFELTPERYISGPPAMAADHGGADHG